MPPERLCMSYSQHCIPLAGIFWLTVIYQMAALDSILATFSDFYLPLFHLMPSMRGIPRAYRVHIWYGKTRTAGLQSGEGPMMIDSVVWAQYINVTEWHTAINVTRHRDSHIAIANAAPTMHSTVIYTKQRKGYNVCQETAACYSASPPGYIQQTTRQLASVEDQHRTMNFNSMQFKVFCDRHRMNQNCKNIVDAEMCSKQILHKKLMQNISSVGLSN